MSGPRINDPSPYYAHGACPSLAWEMTVCQCLAALESPYQTALRRPRRYGEAVAGFLKERIGLAPDWSVVEVGGGYGTLMAALLDVVPLRDVTMVDLSPFFLGEQRKALKDRAGVRFERAEASEFLAGLDRVVDLVVSNENIGDFPAYVGVSGDAVPPSTPAGGGCSERDAISVHVAQKVARYDLDLPDGGGGFAFNIGAIEYLEALAPKARAVFLTEHGSDTIVPPPYDQFVSLPPSNGYPRRVPLKGHDEYTIRFGHLEKVAKKLGYRVHRFHLMELLGLRDDEAVRFMFRAPSTRSDLAQVVHELYDHVAEYQGMLLTKW